MSFGVVQLGPWPPPHGGVQSNLFAIHKLLASKSIPNAVVNLTRHRRDEDGLVYYPKSAQELAARIFQLPHSIIHLHFGGNLTPRLLGLALYCTALPGRKTVLSFHSGGYPSSPEGQSASASSWRGFILRRLDRIIAVNDEIAEVFRRYGVEGHRIRVIAPHAMAVVQPDTNLTAELARFYGSHSDVLLTVGLLEPEYDLPMQIRAIGKIRQRHPGAGLVIIGSGSLEEDLRQLIAEQPWAEHILLCGDVPHAKTLGAIQMAKALLRTTVYDGDAVSVREALHLGTPVIASDNGMRPGGVVLIPKQDEHALCDAIDRVFVQNKPGAPQFQSGMENIEAVFRVYQELAGHKR